jgi:hypothetical protein
MRLFLPQFLRARKQALTDPQAGISIGMIAHLALLAEAERGARGVALFWLALVVANESSVAAMTFPARIARIHATGDDPGGILREVRGILRRVTQCFSDRCGCLRYVCILLVQSGALVAQYSITRTPFSISKG